MKKKIGGSFFLKFISFIPLLLTIMFILCMPNSMKKWWQFAIEIIALLFFGYNFLDYFFHAKSVSIDDNYLYISSVFKKEKVPIANIQSVYLSKSNLATDNQGSGLRWPEWACITIRMKKRTVFGKKIIFSTDYPGEATYSHLKKYETSE